MGSAEAYGEFLTMCDVVHGEGSDEAAKCQVQYSVYQRKQGLFAHTSVLKASKLMRAGEWWQINGVEMPELQKWLFVFSLHLSVLELERAYGLPMPVFSVIFATD
jgi:hypothetical protein